MKADTSTGQTGGLFQRSLGPGPELICVAALLLYIVTALPALGYRDNPEFAVTAYTLGVAHPAGFPTYSLAAKILTFIPLGSIPFRATLFASFFGAAALYWLYLLINRAAGNPGEANRWSASFVTIIFALSSAMWINTTEAEVYSFNLFFLGTILYCALRWSEEKNDAWLYAGAFVYGISSGNHATVAFFLPGLLVYILGHRQPGLVRRLALVLLFFLLGFAVYIYLPIRAQAEPAFNFGNPDTLERFINQITNAKGSDDNFSGVREGMRFFEYFWIFLSKTVPKAFWPAGLPLVVIGFWRLVKQDWPLAVALVLISAANVLFFLRWINPTAFLPTFFSGAVICGVGLSWLMSHWRLFEPDRIVASVRTLWVVLLVLAVGGAWLKYPVRDESWDYLPWETFRKDYEALPSDAIVLSGVLWFHHHAFMDIYRLRDDVVNVGISDLLRPEWFNPVTQERYPRISVPPPPYTDAGKGEYMKRFLTANLNEDRDIYIEPWDMNSGVFYGNMKPELDLLFKFTTRPIKTLSSPTVEAAIGRVRKKVKQEIETERFLDSSELRAYWVTFGFQLASYYQRHMRSGEALGIYKFLEDLYGPAGTGALLPADRARLDVNIGAHLFERGKRQEAVNRLEEAVSINPYDGKAWCNLGYFNLEMNHLEKGREALEKSLALDPDFFLAIYNMGRYYQKKGDTAQAVSYYERALRQAEFPEQKENAQKALDRLKKEGSAKVESLD